MLRIAKSIAGDMLRALLRRVEDGALHLHDGSMPKGPEAAAPSDPIGVIPVARPAGQISGASLDLMFADDAVALRDGRVSWARLVGGNGLPIFDCDAGTGGSATLALNYDEYIVGGAIAVRRLTIVQPTQG